MLNTRGGENEFATTATTTAAAIATAAWFAALDTGYLQRTWALHVEYAGKE